MIPPLRLLWATSVFAGLFFGQTGVAEVPAPEAGIDVLTRGPIHEAFAQLSAVNPDPTPEVPRKPPDPIPELPPDQKPFGTNVQWVPGYWSWDLEKKDFIWVSGCWRAPPPERKWVPGYWGKGDDGFRWVPGFWAPAAQGALQYSTPPPRSLDNGPSTPAPDANNTYVPGVWYQRDEKFVWRAGYWNGSQADWIWQPSQWYWTPGGYLFVPGYWDYGLDNRGLLFAPVCFDQPLWLTPGWCYRPCYCVDPGFLLSSLFCCPSWGCYWFGNCYDPFWAGCGVHPWCNFGPRIHDPLFGHQAFLHRGDPGWHQGLRNTALARRNNDVLGPPSSHAEQRALQNMLGNQQHNTVQAVTHVNQLTGTNGRLASVGTQGLADHRALAQQTQQLSQARRSFEPSNRGGQVAANQPANVGSLKLPAAPATAQARTQQSFYSGPNGNTLSSGAGAPGYRGAPPTFSGGGAHMSSGGYRMPSGGGGRGYSGGGGGGRGGGHR